jgi:hypothetical protein
VFLAPLCWGAVNRPEAEHFGVTASFNTIEDPNEIADVSAPCSTAS